MNDLNVEYSDTLGVAWIFAGPEALCLRGPDVLDRLAALGAMIAKVATDARVARDEDARRATEPEREGRYG